MEEMRRFAGGVAHAVNNILTIIIGHAELLSSDSALSAEALSSVREMLGAGTRARDLMERILVFAGKAAVKRARIDLSSAIAGMRGDLEALVNPGTAVTLTLDSELPLISMDAALLRELICILVDNAGDAMPDGGTLTIRTRRLPPESLSVGRTSDGEAESCVELAIEDTGVGIGSEYVGQVFDPFFTLKPVGKGVGMGLSAAYGIVASARGRIEISSEPDVGTVVRVLFPAVSGPVGDSVQSAAGGDGGRSGGRVLLAEDEDAVRRMLAAALSRSGYQVTEARDGREAADFTARAGRGGFDVLVTDLIMPYIRGSDLAIQLLRLNPEARVVFMSGYTAPEFRSLDLDDERVIFIQKPFTGAQLAEKIHEITGGSGRSRTAH